jgi:hypothetical protein
MKRVLQESWFRSLLLATKATQVSALTSLAQENMMCESPVHVMLTGLHLPHIATQFRVIVLLMLLLAILLIFLLAHLVPVTTVEQ